MMKYTILLCFFYITNHAYSKTAFEIIETEIEQLHNKTEIEKYWIKIHESDQKNNDGSDNYDEKIDLFNLYKVTILINRFGYPTKEFQYPAYMTPWVVWAHCKSTSLKKYTFPILLEGKKQNLIPQEFFPNYFVGGFLISTYGFDMEFDNSFDTNDEKILETTLKHLNKSSKDIKPNKVKGIITEFLKNSTLSAKKNIGTWSFTQHKNRKDFSIRQLNNGDWYLSTKLENGYETLNRLVKKGNKYQVKDGFELFYFRVNTNNKLEIIDPNNKIIKTSE